MLSLDDLFDGRVVVCPSGCWLWTGADSGNGRGGGYGKFSKVVGGIKTWFYVHRWAYELVYGPIPKRWQVDHKCARWGIDPLISRRCCNPDHLEAVPHIVNQQRKLKKAPNDCPF